MKTNSPTPPDPRALRQQAEQKLLEKQSPTVPPPGALVHELQVHQIELEMQNQELQRAQAAAQEAADKYAELFDFAPVGYFVLDPQGFIREVNLAGAALLGLDRQRATGQPFAQYLVPDAHAAFAGFCDRARTAEGRHSCELRLLQHGHSPADVMVEASRSGDQPGPERGCRLAVTDITARKYAEEQLRRLNIELEHRVAARTAELSARNDELTRFNRGMVGRELRMIELKKEVNELCHQAGQPPRYPNYAETEGPK